MDDAWQAAQQQDECCRMQRATEILDAAALRPLTEDERIEIAVEVGLGNMYRKTIKENA